MRNSTKQMSIWGPVALIYVYVVGPFIFMYLEGGYDNTDKVNVTALKMSLSSELNLNITKLDLVFEKMKQNDLLKLSQLQRYDTWNYASSVTYSWTLISTVGWGYIAPVTFWGRLFTIVYSLFGIPFYALFLRCAGVWIKELLTSGLERFELRILGRSTASGLHVKSSILLLILVIGLLLGVAELFSRRNDWTYFEGFYFCFISLSTIGLGDLYYVFSQDVQKLETFLIDLFGGVIFIVGLSLVSTLLCQMSETLEELHFNRNQPVSHCYDDEDSVGGESPSHNGIYHMGDNGSKIACLGGEMCLEHEHSSKNGKYKKENQ